MAEMQAKCDAQLVRDYAEHGSEAAFGELVARHAPVPHIRLAYFGCRRDKHGAASV